MQIHIHKDGKTFGPYSIEQVRQYLKAGNFTGNDLACHDGANWIKLSQVPGITPEPVSATKPVTQAKPKKKIRKGRLAVVTICVFLFLSLIALSIVGLINLMPDDGDESTSSNELFILTPDQVVDVYDGDTFKIDLPSMHPLFGDDLSIRLFGVDTPEMRAWFNR